jgi:hypothetical protein
MTIADMKASASQYAELWRALMPDIEAPGFDQFLMWAGNYSEQQISRGMSGAARKLRAVRNNSQAMTPDDIARYASSIMRNEMMGRRRFN